MKVKHLFLVPRLRSSTYIRTLSAAFPALAHSAQGDIQEPAIPSLKNLVVVDNTPGAYGKVGGDLQQFEEECEVARCAVDFREVLVWREDSPLKVRVAEAAGSLYHDEVMNLQFTRCVGAGGRCIWVFTVRSGTTGAPKAVSVRMRLGLHTRAHRCCSSRITISSTTRSLSHGTCGSRPQTSYVCLPVLHAWPC